MTKPPPQPWVTPKDPAQLPPVRGRAAGFRVRDQVNPYKGNLQKFSIGSPEDLDELSEGEVRNKERNTSREEGGLRHH